MYITHLGDWNTNLEYIYLEWVLKISNVVHEIMSLLVIIVFEFNEYLNTSEESICK